MIPAKPVITWVLVADGARATVLANEGVGRGLHEALPMDFVASNLPTRARVSDRPGRARNARTGRRSSPLAPAGDAHRLEKAAFARRLARQLGAWARRGAFDRLILVAPPRMLGDLRGALDARTRRRLHDTVPKDLTRQPAAAVAREVARALAV